MGSREAIAGRIPEPLFDRFESYREDNGLKTGEAVVRTVDAGCAALGYGKREYRRTPIARVAGELARITGYAGLAVVGIDVATPLELRLAMAVLFAATVVFVLIEQAEPALTTRVGGAWAVMAALVGVSR